jgi:hypothetical protein
VIKLLIFILILATQAFGEDRIQLSFEQSSIHQGALVKAHLYLPPLSLNLPLQKLKGQTFAETIYFHEIGPLLKKNNLTNYESDVHVIFVKKPESNLIQGRVGSEEIIIDVGEVTVEAIEAPGKMIWADFSVPEFIEKNWLWLGIPLILILLCFPAVRMWQSLVKKKKARERRKKLLQDFRSCQSYEEIVKMWEKKHEYIREFPELGPDFQKFEETLFQVQFKPSQTIEEKEIVRAAYEKLLTDSKGGLSGV